MIWYSNIFKNIPQFVVIYKVKGKNTGVGCCALLQGIKPVSLVPSALAGGFFTTCATWESLLLNSFITLNRLLTHSDWFQIGKRVHQGCMLSPCLFNLYAEYIMQNAGLDEAQVESRLPGEISITSDMQITCSKEELKSLLMKV